jgi:hypothetical protein
VHVVLENARELRPFPASRAALRELRGRGFRAASDNDPTDGMQPLILYSEEGLRLPDFKLLNVLYRLNSNRLQAVLIYDRRAYYHLVNSFFLLFVVNACVLCSWAI